VPLPTTARYEFHPSFYLSEEYNDNYNLTATNREDNWRTTLGAGFNLLINDVKTQGYLSTMLNGSWDTAEGGQFTFFPSFTGGLTHTVNPRLSFSLTDTLARSDQYSRIDTSGAQVRGEERELFTSNAFSATVNWLVDRFSTSAFYTNTISFGFDNTISHVLGFNVSAPVGLSTTVSAGYNLSISKTTNAGVDDETNLGNTFYASVSRAIGAYGSAGLSGSYNFQTLDDTKTWNVSVFGTYGLPTGLSVSASLGYSHVTADNGQDDGTLTTNTTISYLFGRVSTSLYAYADFQQTFVTGENLGILATKGVGATVSFPLTAVMSLSLYGSWSQATPTGIGNNASSPTTNTYSGGVSTGVGPLGASVNVTYSTSVLLGDPQAPQFANDQLTVNASLSYQILSFLSSSLSYQYLTRNDPPPQAGKVNQNVVTLSLSASF
jgi:hypothetical protein